MTAGSRLRIAAVAAALAAALPAAPLLAQNSTGNNSDTVGPEQLRDFSLGGNVTRPADPPPATPAPEPRATAPSPATSAAPAPTTRETAPPPSSVSPEVIPTAPPGRTVVMELPPAASADQPGTAAATVEPPLASQPSLTPSTLPPVRNIAAEDGPSLLPWLAAALALGLGALYYATRRRPTLAASAASLQQEPVLERTPGPPPPPAPPARGPVPPPDVPAGSVTTRVPAPEPASSGMISTRLRPTLALQLRPEQLTFDGANAVLRFTIVVTNSGSAPARDILVEANMFNASPTQDQDIGAFFQHPVGKGERLAEIPAGRSVALASEVRLPAERMRVFELNGRKLFVPVIAFNSLYRWIGGEGQTSACFMLGRDTGGEKMGGFHIELGPRVFRSVAAREQPLRVAR